MICDMDRCYDKGLIPRITAPELYPVSTGGVIIRQSEGEELFLRGILFLNNGVGRSAVKESEERRVLPCFVEVAWFSFTEKSAFYAECELNVKQIARLCDEGYTAANGSKGCYAYFDIALFPGGKIAFYLCGDERMKLIGVHKANQTDLPVSAFAPDSGFKDYAEFAEAFINGNECKGDDEPSLSTDETKPLWAEHLAENGVDYLMIERLFNRYFYEVVFENAQSANLLNNIVFSVEFANGEFGKYMGCKMPHDNYGIVRALSFECALGAKSLLYDLYFDINELAAGFESMQDNLQLSSLILQFDHIRLGVTAKVVNMKQCCNLENLRYRIAEYREGRTVFKLGNC